MLHDEHIGEHRTFTQRVEKAAQERIEVGTYQTLVFGVVDGDNSDVVAFGKL